jgi:hypothetical protein
LPPQTAVREATVPDLEDVRKLAPAPVDAGRLQRAVERRDLLVAVVGSEIIGFLLYEWPSGSSAHLRTLAVAEEWRGWDAGEKAPAALLLDEFLIRAPRAGANVILTTASPRDIPTIELLTSRRFFGRPVLLDLSGRDADRDRVLFRHLPTLRPRVERTIATDDVGKLEALLDDVSDGLDPAFATRFLSAVSGSRQESTAYTVSSVKAEERPSGGEHNDDWHWEEFDSITYFEHNYEQLHECDAVIVERVADFFTRANMPADARAIDVGSGANLYPALLMLPFSSQVTLWEFSPRNCRWLQEECVGYRPEWDQFWRIMQLFAPYREVVSPRARLAELAQVKNMSAWELPPDMWDLGTMFFVAESISPSRQDFTDTIDGFLSALKPGAPFAMAFMESSTGYTLSGQDWPTYNVGRQEIEAHVRRRARPGLEVGFIEHDPTLRSGYDGMVLTLGHRA